MPYRRTESVVRRLAARERAIVEAGVALAGGDGLQAVQITAVAERAGIAAGTVYRYFPSKYDLVAEVVADVAGRELEAMRAAADGAPGPLSAIAAGLAVFASRALARRRLAWAMTGEPVDAELDRLRVDFRQSLVAELEHRIRVAAARNLLPDQDPQIAAPALIGALTEGLLGPLAPPYDGPAAAREAVQTMTLLALRALGVVDARARGLVAGVTLP
jgi:AcrR family transcriptional regulator